MLLRPKYTIDSIYHLDVNQLHQLQVKAVFSDLDNTLLAWNIQQTATEMVALNQRLRDAGIQLIVVSNNSVERVGKVLNPYQIAFLARAKKPLPFGIKRALRQFQLTKENVLMVGDQLITDVQASNLAGVRSVLVKPLVNTDKWNTRINRFFEKMIFDFWKLIGQEVTFKEYLK